MQRRPIKISEQTEDNENNIENTFEIRILNRTEIAEMAQAMMPAALKKLETVLHKSGSDLAVLQAFRALKDAAYGKDPQSVNASIDLESLSEDELKAAIINELGSGFTTGHDDAKTAAKAPVAWKPD